MTKEDLYRGVAVVIDEKINTDKEKTDGIGAIIENIENRGIPCVKYRELPKDESLDHYGTINFVVLDWLLKPKDMEDGLQLGDEMKEIIFKANVDFITKLKDKCFAPVFIFTNENLDSVKQKLIEGGIYSEDTMRNFVLVKDKAELSEENKLFEEIEKWIVSSPSVYAMKSWASAFDTAKMSTFSSLFSKSPVWPSVLWNTFQKDSVNQSYGINNTLSALIRAQMDHFLLEEDKVKIVDDGNLPAEELKQVISGTMYLEKDKFPEDSVEPGDIFKKDGIYYINVRPICDTVLGRTKSNGDPAYDGYLHLIPGETFTAKEAKEKGRMTKQFVIKDEISSVMLFDLEGNDFVLFSFKNLRIEPFENFKANRVCRLLSPYSVNVQQKFASYSQRAGLPRLPEDIIKYLVKPPEDSEPDPEKKS